MKIDKRDLILKIAAVIILLGAVVFFAKDRIWKKSEVEKPALMGTVLKVAQDSFVLEATNPEKAGQFPVVKITEKTSFTYVDANASMTNEKEVQSSFLQPNRFVMVKYTEKKDPRDITASSVRIINLSSPPPPPPASLLKNK